MPRTTVLAAPLAAPCFFWLLNATPHADGAGAPDHSPQFMVDEKYLQAAGGNPAPQ